MSIKGIVSNKTQLWSEVYPARLEFQSVRRVYSARHDGNVDLLLRYAK
jgi:hypothetical protein